MSYKLGLQQTKLPYKNLFEKKIAIKRCAGSVLISFFVLAFIISIAEIESLCHANEPNLDFYCNKLTVFYLFEVKNRNSRTVSDLSGLILGTFCVRYCVRYPFRIFVDIFSIQKL